MKLTYKEWGNYIACRTHTLDEDELRKYLEDNFVDVDISEVTNERIKDIIFGEDFGTIIHTANKENYLLSDVIKDWVCDNLYEDDYQWEIYETDVCDDQIVAIED